MPGQRDDNGGHLTEIHMFWYEGTNCGMQHLGQSKVTSRLLQGQSVINLNKQNNTSQTILSTSG